jgi:hypothetical protein
MEWIPLTVRTPTNADTANGNVLFLDRDGKVSLRPLGMFKVLSYLRAWMPLEALPACPPIPNPPEGYKLIDTTTHEPKLGSDLFYSMSLCCWLPVSDQHSGQVGKGKFEPNTLYARKIPPQYRPFANAAEFAPFADEWIKRGDKDVDLPGYWKPTGYDDYGIWTGHLRMTYVELLDKGITFRRDNRPLGMLNEEANNTGEKHDNRNIADR